MDAVATAKLALDASGFDQGLVSAQTSLTKFAKTAGSTIAGAFALDKLISGFSTAIEKGDQLQDLANRFGLAANSIQEIGNAASLSGAGIEDVASAMNKLAKNAGDAIGGNDELAKAFEKIGLTVADLQGMSPQDMFMALSKAVSSGSLGMQDFAVATKLAGKGAASLMETLRMGPDVIAENGKSMGVFSNETIAQLSAASDALKAFQNMAVLAFGVTASAIMDAVEEYARFAAIRPLIKFFDSAKASTTTGNKARTNEIGMTSGLDTTDEKKKLDKSLYDEEIFSLQEEARLKENREKTIFDRMMRDAEFARDEKNRILELEKETAMKQREAILRGMEASGTILDRVRASAERMGMGGLVRQIDMQRQQQQRQTDVSLISSIGARPGERRSFRDNEQINALTQTEGNMQRQQNSDLLNSFNTMQKIVSNILTKIDDKLGVPILKSAY